MQTITEATIPKEIQVSFITKTFPHECPATPFTVPSDCTRMGLSEIVNHLLKDDLEGNIVPFEFLVEYREGKKVFLRTSLKKFFVKIQKYPESIITLEYMESTPPPKHVDTIPHDDWVSAIRPLTTGAIDQSEYVLTGSYDGIARLIKFPLAKKTSGEQGGAGEVLIKTHALSSPITSICGWKDESNGDANELLRYLISCQDETLRLYTVLKQDDKLRVDLKIRFKGHTDGINAIDTNKKVTMACTASDDKTVKIWDLTRTSETKVEEQPNKKKKRIVEVSEGNQVASLDGHILGVTSVKYSPLGDSIISGGMDHTVRIHDLTSGSVSHTIHGSKPPTSLDPSPHFAETPVILCAYPDHIIRLHDTRVSNKATLFKSHKAWVRGVQWITRPTADGVDGSNSFLSWGDDNHLKIWDMRSAVPVHSFKHSDKEQQKNLSDWKVLSACSITDGILSGGTDCMLRKHLL